MTMMSENKHLATFFHKITKGLSIVAKAVLGLGTKITYNDRTPISRSPNLPNTKPLPLDSINWVLRQPVKTDDTYSKDMGHFQLNLINKDDKPSVEMKLGEGNTMTTATGQNVKGSNKSGYNSYQQTQQVNDSNIKSSNEHKQQDKKQYNNKFYKKDKQLQHKSSTTPTPTPIKDPTERHG